MKTVTSVKALREVLSAVDSTGIGLVPTMGALHAGHRSLVEPGAPRERHRRGERVRQSHAVQR